MPGRYFDEWQVGDRVEHSISRTVTETDNLLISTLTHNPQPLHIDHEAAAKTEFGKPLVNSIFTFGLMIGVGVNDTTLGTLVANLGYDKLVFPKPVFVGDTLRSESECIELRESKSRPNAGIVTWAHRSFNQRGELVCECTRSALLAVRPGGQREEDREGDRERGRRRDLRSRGQRRAGPKGRSAADSQGARKA